MIILFSSFNVHVTICFSVMNFFYKRILLKSTPYPLALLRTCTLMIQLTLQVKQVELVGPGLALIKLLLFHQIPGMDNLFPTLIFSLFDI